MVNIITSAQVITLAWHVYEWHIYEINKHSNFIIRFICQLDLPSVQIQTIVNKLKHKHNSYKSNIYKQLTLLWLNL